MINSVAHGAALAALTSAPSNVGIRLEANQIHVWCASLDEFHLDRCRLHDTLSADERVRADRFHSDDDRERYMRSRGILRELLARYLGQPASTIAFTYGQFGKPFIAGPKGRPSLFFNVSHSGALALYALTQTSAVGVDVEQMREIPEPDAIALRHLDRVDADRVLAAPPERRIEEFFLCWTRKEALMKATGEGIGRERSPYPPSSWQLHNLWPAPGYLGAVACKHDAAAITLRSVSKESMCRLQS
ncbi:MAG TPA: 4'-phosphopantetheinyl transferase superfamily protein [Vicinamibacterales bacterium]|jgi:4'-phosphopantetheinyl transferase